MGRFFSKKVTLLDGTIFDSQIEYEYWKLLCTQKEQGLIFNLKRQDPFGIWGLYYGKFPEDPVGDRINDKYEVKEEDDVC